MNLNLGLGLNPGFAVAIDDCLLTYFQALLRGRFLRNDRSNGNNRSTSIAESELGLLRQKQTVSGLRYAVHVAIKLERN